MIQVKQKKTKKVVANQASATLDDLTSILKDLRQEFDAKMEELKPLQDDIAKIEKQLLVEADLVMESTDKQIINGVEIGAKGNQTSITDIIKVAELLTKIEPDLFFKVAKPSITELRKYLTPQELDQCTETKAARKRTLKIK